MEITPLGTSLKRLRRADLVLWSVNEKKVTARVASSKVVRVFISIFLDVYNHELDRPCVHRQNESGHTVEPRNSKGIHGLGGGYALLNDVPKIKFFAEPGINDSFSRCFLFQSNKAARQSQAAFERKFMHIPGTADVSGRRKTGDGRRQAGD
jgi:hypothetical protein